MFYRFELGLQQVQRDQCSENELLYGICTHKELETHIKEYNFSMNTYQDFMRTSHTIHKMDSYYGYDFGILHIIHKKEEGFERVKIGMYIHESLVLIVCDDPVVERQLFDAVDKMNEKTFCLEHMVTSVINFIISGNLKMIEHMENRLVDIDEQILNNKTDGFNQKTSIIRNDLLYLTHYYEQLADVCEELLQDENDFFENEEIHHLRILTDRINRLHGNVHLLKDYLLQIREACKSQVDMNLNHIMYIFTVVTTVFLPLTLIVGWYGMNFKNMPELSWQYGYLSVIIISVFIIVACIWFFRKKKLLK